MSPLTLIVRHAGADAKRVSVGRRVNRLPFEEVVEDDDLQVAYAEEAAIVGDKRGSAVLQAGRDLERVRGAE